MCSVKEVLSLMGHLEGTPLKVQKKRRVWGARPMVGKMLLSVQERHGVPNHHGGPHLNSLGYMSRCH